MGWLLPVGLGVAGLIEGLVGQNTANKAQSAQEAEAARASKQRYDFLQSQVNASNARRTATLQFAKSAAKARGFNIPDEAFDSLINSPGIGALPAYSAPVPGYKPSPWAAGIAGGVGAATQAFSLTDYLKKLALQKATAKAGGSGEVGGPPSWQIVGGDSGGDPYSGYGSDPYSGE